MNAVLAALLVVVIFALIAWGTKAMDGGEYKTANPVYTAPAPDAPTTADVKTTQAVDVIATEIPLAYIDNAVAADNRLKGRLLRVTGRILGITTDVSGVPVIKLEDGVSDHPILCMFSAADIKSIGSMHSGRSVSVTGAFERIDQNLYLNGCSLGLD